ncbi:hypothetical protein DQ04_08471000 [Trypanosoma grayi]|uniref:hypothetical protein n=1 Tax=Trypanosoma grayi TaxID=71804 RepID=UPI0004F40302|nr:hypothetical protein DQ04_08471000 [Trypanosoma grayi]KEG07919.1 hypothetical protein DQ04_08471000 [Trypanosoma grayi]
MVVSDRFGTRGGDDRQQRRVKSASSVASFSANAWSNPRGSGSESAEAAAVEVKRDATPDAVSAVRRSTGGVAMTDAVLPRSSPPPRPKQSATVPLTTASSIPSRTAAVWTGGRRRVDVDQLRQRLASCDVANMSLLDSRGWANSPSVATPLEKENCVPGTAKVGVHATDPCSEAYYARYDAEVNRRYNESRASRGWEPDATIEPSSSSSPSPKVPQQGGVQRILAPVAANLPQQMFLPPGEEVSPHSNSNVSTVAVVRHWYHDGDDNAEGRSTQGRIIAVDAVRLSQKEPICAPPLPLLLSPPPLQHQTTRLRGRPLPPQSPSRRAISRVQQGQPRHVEPVVPRTRAPPTPPGRCVVDSLAK